MERKLGWPFPKRKKYLDELVSNGGTRTYDVPFQGRTISLPRNRVRIELPKYRLANGRTLASQAEYLAKNTDLPADFFTRDLESEEAQRAQHALLKELIPGAGLLAHFKKHEQTDPLILTNTGFVLNGNRRLCAMRELFWGQETKYAHFEHVEVVILPPASEEDLDEIEAHLQIHPDIKEEYSWYATAMMMRRRRSEHNLTWDQLEARYGIKANDIKQMIYMLEDGELWLADRKCPGRYHLLEGKEFAFRQFHQNKDSDKLFSNDHERKAFERISYALFDEDPKGGRLYDSIPSVAKGFREVVANLRDDLSLNTSGDLSDVIAAANDPKRQDQVREIVSKTIYGIRLRAKEQKKQDFVLDQVRRANTALVDALNAYSSKTPKEGIAAQLEEISKNVGRLESKLRGD